jgi:hypothetical protein
VEISIFSRGTMQKGYLNRFVTQITTFTREKKYFEQNTRNIPEENFQQLESNLSEESNYWTEQADCLHAVPESPLSPYTPDNNTSRANKPVTFPN